MNIETFSDRWFMNFEYYIKQPMHMVELNLNMSIATNPDLINSLDRKINHSLIRKYSNIPFNYE